MNALSHLDRLEAESIHIFREVAAEFSNPVMLYSIGKDSAVLLHLLAPNQRVQQVTDDLRSFWDQVYPRVRKDLRGRYPKHAWPEDPWHAKPDRK